MVKGCVIFAGCMLGTAAASRWLEASVAAILTQAGQHGQAGPAAIGFGLLAFVLLVRLQSTASKNS